MIIADLNVIMKRGSTKLINIVMKNSALYELFSSKARKRNVRLCSIKKARMTLTMASPKKA